MQKRPGLDHSGYPESTPPADARVYEYSRTSSIPEAQEVGRYKLDAQQAEIERLTRRVQELEALQGAQNGMTDEPDSKHGGHGEEGDEGGWFTDESSEHEAEKIRIENKDAKAKEKKRRSFSTGCNTITSECFYNCVPSSPPSSSYRQPFYLNSYFGAHMGFSMPGFA